MGARRRRSENGPQGLPPHSAGTAALEAEVDAPETVVICVPTPLSADGIPDLTAVRGASELAGRILRPGMLVVLESTSYPGTTDEVVRPPLEKTSGLDAGLDFSLAFSPERIDSGNKAYGLRNTPKGARVLLRGVSYKRDIANTRESPVPAVAHRLLTRGHCFPITTPMCSSGASTGTHCTGPKTWKGRSRPRTWSYSCKITRCTTWSL